MPGGLASLLGDSLPSLDELHQGPKKSAPAQDRTQSLKEVPKPVVKDLPKEPPTKDSSENDLISSILDQVTSGFKSQYIPANNKPKPNSPPQTQSAPVGASPKKKNRNKTKFHTKRQNTPKPIPVHLDTPNSKSESDFDSEMDSYFKAQIEQDKKKEETIGVKRKMTIEEVAGEILGKPVKKKNIWNSKSSHQAPQRKFVPLVPCLHYAQGYCPMGEKCTFKHDNTNDPEVCPYWIKGKCKNDKLCRFLHKGPRDIKICPFFKIQSCSKGDSCHLSHDLSLEPCRFFHIKGTCEQGEGCPYSHEPLTSESLQQLRRLTGPCRFWQFKGYCVTGDKCFFSHDDVSEEERKKLESTITPCIFYHLKNGCRTGDECFYLHAEATPEQIEQLKKNELQITKEQTSDKKATGLPRQTSHVAETSVVL